MNLRVWCPYCRQGWVHRKRANGVDPFWVCEECESVWLTADVGPQADTALIDHLQQVGSTARYWTDLEDSPEQLIEPSSES
jgi:hypothetical protein